MMNPEYLVDIPMCVYNHEKFISQAIEGVINQKTDFNYRLIIGEDCSTDNTREIVKEYLLNYPDKIVAIFHDKNVGAYENSRILFESCNSKYIALCDGDDFWTDPLKLQKQIDFLESNADYILCSANASVDNLTNKSFRSVYCHYNEDKSFDQRQVLMGFYCPTLSMVFRNHLKDLPEWFHDVKSGDTFLQLILSQYGKFYFMNFIAGVYRQHNAGISNLNDQIEWYENNIIHLQKFKKIINTSNVPFLNEFIYKNQLEYINVLRGRKEYKKAFLYFNKLIQIPFLSRQKYFKKRTNLFFRTLTRS